MDDTPTSSRSRSRTLLVAGLVVAAASVVALAAASAATQRTDLVAAGPPQVVDGTVRMTYILPGGTTLLRDGMLMGSYDFPTRAGDVLVMGCRDHRVYASGGAPGPDAVVLHDVRRGMFHEETRPVVGDPAAGAAPCASPVFVVLAWDATGDWTQNRPAAVIELVQNPTMQGPVPGLLVGALAVGGVTSLAGGLGWRRERLRGT